MYLIVNIQGMNCDFVIRQTFQLVSTVFHSVSGFFFGSSLLDWESARIDCERRGMRLVCLKNLTMYEAAKSYLQETLVR